MKNLFLIPSSSQLHATGWKGKANVKIRLIFQEMVSTKPFRNSSFHWLSPSSLLGDTHKEVENATRCLSVTRGTSQLHWQENCNWNQGLTSPFQFSRVRGGPQIPRKAAHCSFQLASTNSPANLPWPHSQELSLGHPGGLSGPWAPRQHSPSLSSWKPPLIHRYHLVWIALQLS